MLIMLSTILLSLIQRIWLVLVKYRASLNNKCFGDDILCSLLIYYGEDEHLYYCNIEF